MTVFRIGCVTMKSVVRYISRCYNRINSSPCTKCKKMKWLNDHSIAIMKWLRIIFSDLYLFSSSSSVVTWSQLYGRWSCMHLFEGILLEIIIIIGKIVVLPLFLSALIQSITATNLLFLNSYIFFSLFCLYILFSIKLLSNNSIIYSYFPQGQS